MRRSSIVQIVSGGTMLGVVAAGNFSLGRLVISVSVFLCFVLLLRRKILRFYGLVLIAGVALLLGAVRWQMALVIKTNDVSRFVSSVPQIISGTITSEPEPIGESQRLILNVISINEQSASGKARITLARYPSYEFGQVIKLQCALQSITSLASSASLARQGIGALCSRPTNVRVQAETATIHGYLFKFKATLQRSLDSVLPEPQSALLAGLLWGSRSNLPDIVKNDFKRAGMSHQVAVSGFNTTIIAAFLSALLFRLGFNRMTVLIASSLGLASFVIISGASAAVMRAAIMSLTVLIAQWLGRPSSAGSTLIMAAAVMVIVNPWLVYDIGFQLSAAATAGLIYVSPLFKPSLHWLPERFGLQENMATTLAATLTTLPVTIGHFGQFSIISPLANALTLPLLPLTMACGAIAVGAGLIWPLLGQAFGLVVWLPLSYLMAIPHWLGNLFWAAITLSPIGWTAIFLYAPIVALLIRQHKKNICPLAVG